MEVSENSDEVKFITIYLFIPSNKTNYLFYNESVRLKYVKLFLR